MYVYNISAGKKQGSRGASSSDGHKGQSTSPQQQQQQQRDDVENFRQSYLNSGKFNPNLI